MKYCPNCAREQNKENKFCEICGEKFNNNLFPLSNSEKFNIFCCIFIIFGILKAIFFYTPFGISQIIGFHLFLLYKIKYHGKSKITLILMIIMIILIVLRAFDLVSYI